MVVLAAAVLTKETPNKSSKVLLSRQYVEMSRIRIEGLLAALPRLMSSGSQHTFIETESVRYLYQPFESMLVVLVTNKGSNIVEDLETLRMMGRLMSELVPLAPDVGQGTARTEVEVSDAAFDIIFAFDEMMSLGYRDHITVDGVLKNLEMRSQEEDHAKEIEAKKVVEAEKKAKKEAHRIHKLKLEQKRAEESGSFRAPVTETIPVFEEPEQDAVDLQQEAKKPAPPPKKLGGGTGMQIGGLKSKKDVASAVLEEEGGKAVGPARPKAAARPVGAAAGAARGGVSDVLTAEIKITEQVQMSFDADGDVVKQPKIKGSLNLTVPNPEFGFFEMAFRPTLDRANFDFQPFPKLDDKYFKETNILRSKKENNIAFPIGKSTLVLKWSAKLGSSFDLPLSVSIWGDEDSVLLQYTLRDDKATFVNLVIKMPGPNTGAIDNTDIGECFYDANEGMYTWTIDKIDGTCTQAGVTISWSSPVPTTELQPLNVELTASKPQAGVDVADVMPTGVGALWYRRRMALLCSGRRSSALGKLAQKSPEALRNIVEFL